MDDVLKCYKVLDLPPGSTAEQIRKTYIELAHVWHPDRFQSNPVLREQARKKMLEIEDAYKTLTGFLPVVRKDDTLETEASVEPEKIVDILEVSDSHTPLKYTIAAFLVLVIACILFFAIKLVIHSRSTPAQFS